MEGRWMSGVRRLGGCEEPVGVGAREDWREVWEGEEYGLVAEVW